MSDLTPLEALAEWTAGLRTVDVPDDLHRLSRLRILDTLGLIAVGAQLDAGAAVAAWSQSAAADAAGLATNLATGDYCEPATAALVHGTLAHARDFDDTFIDAVVHPGSTIIPVALALAQAQDLDLDETTTAIAAGYEVAARLGSLAGRGFHARGFHATSVIGPVAAAAAAGRLLKLDAGQLADAMGLSTSMSGGLMAFLADGGWSKWLHTGWSAHGGITAAGLARNGFRGPRHALEHGQGLYGAFLGEVPAGLDRLTEGLGQIWYGQAAAFKLYPCAHVIHPYIEAALSAAAEHNLRIGEISAVACVMAPWAMPIVAEPREPKVRPRNALEAIASLPYMVAYALQHGTPTLAALEAPAIADAGTLGLAARIMCRSDASLGAAFDGTMLITLTSGRSLDLAVSLPANDPDRIAAKFRANVRMGGLTDGDVVMEALASGATRVGEVMRLVSLRRA